MIQSTSNRRSSYFSLGKKSVKIIFDVAGWTVGRVDSDSDSENEKDND